MGKTFDAVMSKNESEWFDTLFDIPTVVVVVVVDDGDDLDGERGKGSPPRLRGPPGVCLSRIT
jgi:hypothetical protein